VVAYFFNFFQLFQKKKKIYIKAILCNFSMRLLKCFLKKIEFFFALKKLLTLAEIPSFQKFLFYCPTAQMAEVMVQNVAYRATVYITGA
jgi:hypothetical protein